MNEKDSMTSNQHTPNNMMKHNSGQLQLLTGQRTKTVRMRVTHNKLKTQQTELAEGDVAIEKCKWHSNKSTELHHDLHLHTRHSQTEMPQSFFPAVALQFSSK